VDLVCRDAGALDGAAAPPTGDADADAVAVPVRQGTQSAVGANTPVPIGDLTKVKAPIRGP